MSVWRLAGLIAALLALRLGLYALAAGSLPALPEKMCAWDCSWYLHTAKAGYDLVPVTVGRQYSQANWAFFPVFPLGIRVLALAMPYAVAGFVLANGCFAVFMGLAAAYWRQVRGQGSAAALLVFLVAFPYGLYFSAPYTESCYAALAMAMLLLLSEKRFGAASLVSAVLVAVRITGILLVPVLAVALLRPAWVAWRQGNAAVALRTLADAALPLAVAPLGLFLFIAYLHAHMGDGLAFLHVEAGWYRRTAFPFTVLAMGLLHFDLGRLFSFGTQSVFFSMLCALAGLGLSARLGVQRHWAEAWFLGVSVLIALAAGYTSDQRYVLANPVFLIALFDLLWNSWARRGFWVMMAGCGALQLYLVHLWVQAYAALM